MPLKPCLDCGALSDRSRCRVHRARAQQARDQARGNSAQRGYGHAHRARRQAMLPEAYGKPCPQCGVVMGPDMALDAGHSIPLAHDPNAKADRIECAECNRTAGGRTRGRSAR